jgi:DNA-binding NarL/FixJ family response regulator
MPLRVLVAESDEVIQQVMAGLVASQAGWEPCAPADGADVISAISDLRPDVAVLDISLLRPDNWTAARRILASFPGQRFIVTGGADPATVGRDVFNAGGLGYVLKATATSDLVTAIKAVCDGRTFFTPRIAESLLQDYLKGEQDASVKHAALSERERMALKFLAREAASTMGTELARPRRVRPSTKYAIVFLIVVVTAGLGWMRYHDALEEKFPWIGLILGKTKLKAMPSEIYKGNPDVKVWIDMKTGLYYCPGSQEYGKTARGKYAKQRNAQLDEFEPANRKGCD